MQNHLDDLSGVTIGSYAFQAFSEVYAAQGADLATILTPQARAILPEMSNLCLLTHIRRLHAIATPVVGSFALADPTTVEPWTALLRENSAGSVGFDAPLFVAQGLGAQLVRPADTDEFVQHERGLSMDVTYRTVRIADHATIAYLAPPALLAWLDSVGV